MLLRLNVAFSRLDLHNRAGCLRQKNLMICEEDLGLVGRRLHGQQGGAALEGWRSPGSRLQLQSQCGLFSAANYTHAL